MCNKLKLAQLKIIKAQLKAKNRRSVRVRVAKFYSKKLCENQKILIYLTNPLNMTKYIKH